MFTTIAITSVPVLDQEEALAFYRDTLGLEIGSDVDMGFMRWLTVHAPGDPDHQLLLEVPGPPATSEEIAAQVRDLTTKGAMGVLILATDDCRRTFAALQAKGVEVTQGAGRAALRHRLRHPRPVRQPHPHLAEGGGGARRHRR